MNILIYNPAALNGGAISVLNSFIQDIANDSNNNYWVIVSDEATEVHYVDVPHVSFVRIKRNYINRLKWLYIIIPQFIRDHKIDALISLENTSNILLKRTPQYVYLHQSLQFSPSGVLSWKLYFKIKVINGLLIKFSCRKAAGVVVQTKWMRKAVVDRFGVDGSRIHVVSPHLPKHEGTNYDNAIIEKVKKLQIEKRYVGICVTNASSYKRLETLIHFVTEHNRNPDNVPVHILFTISIDENSYSKNLYNLARKLGISENIIFIGKVSAATLHKLYDTCDAMFYSSSIETFGLPLVEAMSHKLRIFAPNLPYVNDVCGNYATLYNFDDFSNLEEQFKKRCYDDAPQNVKYKGESFLRMIDLIRLQYEERKTE